MKESMNDGIQRRRFLGQLGGLSCLGASILSTSLRDANAADAPATELSPKDQQAKDRATQGSYYWAWWGWEPWEHNRRAGGITGGVDGASTWLHQWYARLHREETVALMAEVGVNMAVTHFFKGFGLEHERDEQQRTAQLVQIAHKHGIRVIGYCQFRSIYYETFLVEQPLPEDWEEVAGAVEKVAGGRLTARLRESDKVALSAFRVEGDRLAVHLVNYGAPKSTGPLRLELGVAWATRRTARWLTPEGPERTLAVTGGAEHAAVEVPPLDVYGIVVVE